MLTLFAGALLGVILGRFFKVYILAPVSVVAIILTFSGPDVTAPSFYANCLELAALLVSIQFGYVAGLASHQLTSAYSIRRRPWSSHAVASRTLHVR